MLPAGVTYAGLDAGAGNTTAWLSDGSLVEWGLALASPTSPSEIAAPPLPSGIEYVDVAVGGTHAAGQLGDISCQYTDFDFTYAHVVALRSDGSVVAWGNNNWYQVVDPWTDLGGGTEGLAGTPELSGSGTPLEGNGVTLLLSWAPPNALVLAWLSLDSTPFSALGGTVHAYPWTAQFIQVASNGGGAGWIGAWPAGVPGGTEIWVQFLVQDASSVHGITLSNGVKVEVP